jgi:hypothetical protein
MSFSTTSGTLETRFSPTLVSAGIPIRMKLLLIGLNLKKTLNSFERHLFFCHIAAEIIFCFTQKRHKQ